MRKVRLEDCNSSFSQMCVAWMHARMWGIRLDNESRTSQDGTDARDASFPYASDGLGAMPPITVRPWIAPRTEILLKRQQSTGDLTSQQLYDIYDRRRRS